MRRRRRARGRSPAARSSGGYRSSALRRAPLLLVRLLLLARSPALHRQGSPRRTRCRSWSQKSRSALRLQVPVGTGHPCVLCSSPGGCAGPPAKRGRVSPRMALHGCRMHRNTSTASRRGLADHRCPTGAEACPQPRNERVRRDCARRLDDPCPCAADMPWCPPTIESFAQFRSLKSLELQASLLRGCVNRGRFTSPASQRMLTARRTARNASSWMCQAGRLASQHPKGGTP
jgi:hypothetical protein